MYSFCKSTILLQCSAIRQVPGSQTLHSCRSSALLFKSPYRSFSSKSSIIPIRFLPGPLLPSIFPSITSFISPSPLIICPIQFFFLRTIVSTIDLFSPTLLKIPSHSLSFPSSLHVHVCKRYPFYSFNNPVSWTCQTWRASANDDLLWKKLFRRRHNLPTSSSISWAPGRIVGVASTDASTTARHPLKAKRSEFTRMKSGMLASRTAVQCLLPHRGRICEGLFFIYF